MRITKQTALIVYGTSTERIQTAIHSDKLQGGHIVGICTDELILGNPTIDGIPLIQISDIVSHRGEVVILLDTAIPETYKNDMKQLGLPLINYGDLIIEEDNDQIRDTSGHMAETQSASGSAPEAVQEEAENNDKEGFDDNSVNEVTSQLIPDRLIESQVEESPIIAEQQDERSIDEPSSIPEQQAEDSIDELPAYSEDRVYFSDEQFESIRSIVATSMDKLFAAVSNSKSKDVSIYNINKELQKFKDGYYNKITSPFASELISLREDFKKSVDDCAKYELTYPKLCNSLDCTIEQIDDILTTFDVSIAEGKYLYNGNEIYPTLNRIGSPIQSTREYDPIDRIAIQPELLPDETRSVDLLIRFFASAEERLLSCIQHDEALIKSIEIQNNDLKKQASITDGMLIIPLLRKIIRLKLSFAHKRREIDTFREEADSVYTEAYEYGISFIESILASIGVFVRVGLDDLYDPKYHRMIKKQAVTAEDAEKDKHIASYITDCYVNNDRVIAPAKVVVYKL